MNIASDITALIGNTPLLRLRKLSEETGCEILGKAEFLNPGGSVKDRTALGIIRHALNSGQLHRGGRIVEGTAGNTGIGLALVGHSMGFRSTIVMPETQSLEKRDALLLAGAEVTLVPAVPYRDENHYTRVARRLALEYQQHGNAIWANQFDNTANRDVHYQTTGQEIWQQTEGRVDAFCCAVGTGGTLAGVGSALRNHNAGVKIFLSDAMGASLYHYYRHGELKAEGSSVMEGIGQSRVTENLVGFTPDGAFQIPDDEALNVLDELMQSEGLALGGSSGINVAGAVRVARHLGPGHCIVTVLCDGAARYRSKLYNPDFLREKALPVPRWLELE